MPKRSNNLLGNLLLDLFKALPPAVQGVILVGIAIVGSVVGIANVWRSNPVTPATVVIETAEFDPRNPERTCRWILASSVKAREVTRSVVNYKGSNPLRTDRDAEMQKAQADYSAVIQSKVGTRIVWPVLVDRINQDEVQIKMAFDGVEQDGIRANIYMRYEEFAQGRESYRIVGKLKIGKSITLKEAKQLDEGARLFVDGVIESIKADIPSYSRDGSGISIDVKDCKAILAAPVTERKP